MPNYAIVDDTDAATPRAQYLFSFNEFTRETECFAGSDRELSRNEDGTFTLSPEIGRDVTIDRIFPSTVYQQSRTASGTVYKSRSGEEIELDSNDLVCKISPSIALALLVEDYQDATLHTLVVLRLQEPTRQVVIYPNWYYYPRYYHHRRKRHHHHGGGGHHGGHHHSGHGGTNGGSGGTDGGTDGGTNGGTSGTTEVAPAPAPMPAPEPDLAPMPAPEPDLAPMPAPEPAPAPAPEPAPSLEPMPAPELNGYTRYGYVVRHPGYQYPEMRHGHGHHRHNYCPTTCHLSSRSQCAGCCHLRWILNGYSMPSTPKGGGKVAALMRNQAMLNGPCALTEDQIDEIALLNGCGCAGNTSKGLYKYDYQEPKTLNGSGYSYVVDDEDEGLQSAYRSDFRFNEMERDR